MRKLLSPHKLALLVVLTVGSSSAFASECSTSPDKCYIREKAQQQITWLLTQLPLP